MKPVYILSRGYLNGVAVYSMSMLGSLIAMLSFRRRNKFKSSEMANYINNFKKMKSNGLCTLYLAALLVTASCYIIFWNTFPDSIAVFNPFKAKLGIKGVEYDEAFLIFTLAFFMVLVLTLNSIKFTGPSGNSFKSIQEFSKVSFSMNMMKSEYYSSYATVAPILMFFLMILIAYQYGNAFGISLCYLGCICYGQIIQFFQNFKNLPYYYIGIMMAAQPKEEDEVKGLDDNFSELMHFCRYFGKFSTGVSLFIHKVMCFAILVDSFNMHIVDHINLIQPYSLIAIMFGCVAIQVFISLDHICATRFVKFFLHRLNFLQKENVDDPDFQPPIDEIHNDLLQVSFMSEFMILFLPVRK